MPSATAAAAGDGAGVAQPVQMQYIVVKGIPPGRGALVQQMKAQLYLYWQPFCACFWAEGCRM